LWTGWGARVLKDSGKSLEELLKFVEKRTILASP